MDFHPAVGILSNLKEHCASQRYPSAQEKFTERGAESPGDITFGDRT
jgi:hypothetical protein